jgi:diaminopimelate epimerase
MTDHPLDTLSGQPFLVMDGAGNDFVIADLRQGGSMTQDAARFLGDRKGPFGCDQIITLEARDTGPAMGIFNGDGSLAGACGNAARCIAWLLMKESGEDTCAFQSPSGPLRAWKADGVVTVDMGRPRLDWQDIPLARAMGDTAQFSVDPKVEERFALGPASAVSMGNPHVIYRVPSAKNAPLHEVGPLLTGHPLFPEGVNVSVLEERGDDLVMRTFERGAGLTQACGTAACAGLVTACRLGRKERSASVHLPGGRLRISWDEEGSHVAMGGPVRLHQRGTFES